MMTFVWGGMEARETSKLIPEDKIIFLAYEKFSYLFLG